MYATLEPLFLTRINSIVILVTNAPTSAYNTFSGEKTNPPAIITVTSIIIIDVLCLIVLFLFRI